VEQNGSGRTGAALEDGPVAAMGIVAERALALTGATGAIVELAEGDEIVYRAASGAAALHLGMRLARPGSLSGASMDHGVPLRWDDTIDDPRVDRAACERVDLRAMLVAPIVVRHGPVGVLKVLSNRVRAFDADDTANLVRLAGVLAAAIAPLWDDPDARAAAFLDRLTGLPDRALLFDHLHQNVVRARGDGALVGVLSINIDDLALVNEHHGRAVGDEVLVAVAKRVQGAVRSTDVPARTGGDDFGVLCRPVADPHEVELLAERVRKAVGRPVRTSIGAVAVVPSVGLAVAGGDAVSADALVRMADFAMYEDQRAARRRAPRT
jgi:diguanylate cyclase (GGDEF)-like protein